MTERKNTKGGGAPHRFGGDWTTVKLGVIAAYLQAYTTALKDKPSPKRPFRKGYIDAFAGTGYREVRRNDPADQSLLLPDLAEEEPQGLLDGSARLALKTDPRFDSYIFIERSAKRCAELEVLREEFPDLADDIEVRQGDANQEIQALCDTSKKDWSSHRAVLFLDPYGMQVDWTTIEAVAGTKAIDLWLLFPLGIGVNRLLKKSGDIPDSWRAKLNVLLGTEDWYEEFFKVETTPTLFGEQERVVKATMETIGRYFNDRLREVFAGVADQPGVLRNSVNNPLYLLCFAMGNERGKETGLRIANSLLRKVR